MRNRTFQHLKTLGIFFAPEKGGETNPGGKPTLEQQLATANSELTKATDSLNAITVERDKSAADLVSVTTERDNLKAQFDQATTSAESLRKELADANSKVTSITVERDAAQKSLNSTNENVTRLEKLCSLRGIDPKSAVPPEGEPQNPTSTSEFQAKLASAKSQEDRDQILSEFSKAAREGKVS